MENTTYCPSCKKEISTEEKSCPVCGKVFNDKNTAHQLRIGTILHNKYVVGEFLGEGGFGITYIGKDTTLDMPIAIKEFFPSGYANRNNQISNEVTASQEKQKLVFLKGKERFLKEARAIAKFNFDRGVVNVRDFFEENGTAYIIMDYLDGENLLQYMDKKGIFRADDLARLMIPIMLSLSKIHAQGIIHRDVSPDNIMYISDGSLVLTDFGNARHYTNREVEMSVMLKQGYSPEEQYKSKGVQGPWTDVYGLCATIYRCITGRIPSSALDRLEEDDLKRPSELGINISKKLEEAIMSGLAVKREDRCQNMNDLMMSFSDALNLENNAPYILYDRDNENLTISADDIDFNKTRYADDYYDDTNLDINHNMNGRQYSSEAVYSSNNINKNSKMPIIVTIVVTITILILIGLTLAFFINRSSNSSNEKIIVPNCVGLKKEEVSDELSGFNIEYKEQYSDEVKKGNVINQSIKAGESAVEGSNITIYISKGMEAAPEGYTQKVTVLASPKATSGTLSMLQWEDGEWVKKMSCYCTLGSLGISGDYGEGKSATPKGTFPINNVLISELNASGLETDLNKVGTNSKTVVVDNPQKDNYNKIINGGEGDPIGKHLETDTYAAIFIEHNGDGFDSAGAGAKGSSITICGMTKELTKTAGCIDISKDNMIKLCSLLDINEKPHIEIGYN